MAHLPLRRTGVFLATLASVAALAAAPTQAAPNAVPSCDPATATKPFLPWLDPLPYVFAPNGGLEEGSTGWKLAGGAKVVSGNEPFYVHGQGESRSLLLPKGSSATTAPMCIGLLHPTIRFFANAPLLSTMRVQVLFGGPLGILSTVEGGLVVGSGKWSPTLPVVLLANVTAPLGTNSVQFRFTPLGRASWQVDDVYVDPWVSR